MKITNETKVGVLAAVAIAILIIGYSFLKGNDVFSRENDYYAMYKDVSGLTTSKAILVNGYQVGRVAELKLMPNGLILAKLRVNPQYKIPKNTIAKLTSIDMLGDKAIVFELGNSSQSAKSGDTLQANVQKGLMKQVEPLQKKAEQMVARLDSILVIIHTTLSPSFQKHFNSSFASISNTLKSLDQTTEKIDKLVGAESIHIAAMFSNLESISNNLRSNNDRINVILNNVDKIAGNVAKVNFEETIANANQAMADLQRVVNKVNAGQGSLAELINNKDLYGHLENAAKNLEELAVDLKANPKRYVHFSIFGRKKN